MLLGSTIDYDVQIDPLSGAKTYTPVGGTLLELNPADGTTIRTIGSIGYVLNGLQYDLTSGILYGSTSNNDPSGYKGLVAINMSTGAGSPIGTGWGLVPPLGGPSIVTNITASSAGQLYGWWEQRQDDLVRIDKTTGTATPVGDSGLTTAYYALDFDAAGTFYMFDGSTASNPRLRTIDPSSGLTTQIGSSILLHHGDFDPVSGHYFGLEGLFFDANRYLLEAELVPNSTGGVDVSLVSKTNLTPIYPESQLVQALTFVRAPQAVPEPGTLFTVGAGLLGLWGISRRRS
jgi:hypothetical protein